MSAYRSRPIRRRRRSQDEIFTIKLAIHRLLATEHPMTVRQVFYRLVSEGVVAKTEAEYKGTVCRLLTEMRLAHTGDPLEAAASLSPTIPFGWISDSTRWMRKPISYSSVEQALRRTAETYRRSLWDEQDAYVEVWLEKDALAGVLYQETNEWDVPLMVTRGYPSLSFVAEAADHIDEIGKPTFLYYLGDHDPSGLDIPRHTEERLRELAPFSDIHFERLAVTAEQIEDLNLPTRPTKKADTRSRSFAGESVEVDAIPPAVLRQIVRGAITFHVDHHALELLQMVEADERKLLKMFAQEVTS